MNHYNKVRKTLAQMTNLRDACNELIKQCEAELNKQPIDASKTIEELKTELELDELQEEFENIAKQPAPAQVQPSHTIKFNIDTTLKQLRTSAELQAEKQRLFEAKEQIIRNITRNDNDNNS